MALRLMMIVAIDGAGSAGVNDDGRNRWLIVLVDGAGVTGEIHRQ